MRGLQSANQPRRPGYSGPRISNRWTVDAEFRHTWRASRCISHPAEDQSPSARGTRTSPLCLATRISSSTTSQVCRHRPAIASSHSPCATVASSQSVSVDVSPLRCPPPSESIDFLPVRLPPSHSSDTVTSPCHGGLHPWQRHCRRWRSAASGALYLPRDDRGEDTRGDPLPGCRCGQRGAAASRAGLCKGGGCACGH